MVLTLLPGAAAEPAISVIFDANGGNPASQIVGADLGEPYGMVFARTEPPTKIDEDLSYYSGRIVWMNFLGWFASPDDTDTEILPTDTVTTDSPRRLYAHWGLGSLPLPVSVTFHANGGSPATQSAETAIGETYGALFESLTAPTKDGYTFDGWFTASDNSGAQVHSIDTVTADSPRALFAHWQRDVPPPVSVTFHANGGSPATQSAETTIGKTYGTLFESLVAPTKDGYTFDGWFTASDSSGTQVHSIDTVTADSPRTLFAHWQRDVPPPVSVTFYANGGSPATQSAETALGETYGALFESLAAPTKDGYTFDGWFTASDSSGAQVHSIDTVTADSPRTLFAHWQRDVPPPLFATFRGNSGAPDIQLIPTTAGTTFAALLAEIQTPVRDQNWAFAGWQTVNGAIPASDYLITTDTTFYAQWTPITSTNPAPTVTFHANSGNPPTQTVGAEIGESYSTVFGRIASPTKIDETLSAINNTVVMMEFVGWFTAPDNSGTQIHGTDMVTADSPRTLYAHWRSGTIPDLELTFDGNGGTPGTQAVRLPSAAGQTFADATAEIVSPTRHGYHFLGWAVLFDPAGLVFSPILSPSEPLHRLPNTFYAQWAVNTSMPRVTFDANGGTPTTQTVIAAMNEPYDALFGRLTQPTRANMEFVGWFTTPDGPGVQVHPTDRVTATSTIHARWRNIAAPNIMVSFYGNGGSPQSQDIRYAQVSGATFAEAFAMIATPTRAGHRFIGWAGVSVAGDVSPIILPTDPIRPGTFYAQWAPDNIPTALRITFHANGGSPITQTVDAVVGEPFHALFARIQQPIRVDEEHSTPDVDRMMTFNGWNTTPRYGGMSIGPNDIVTADSPQVLYARWIGADAPITPDSTTIHFMGNGGTPAHQVTHAYLGSPYETAMARVAQPAREGFTFTGWFTQSAGGVQVMPTDRMRTHNYAARLYAQWEPIEESTPPPPPHIRFHDVAAGRWYYDYIQFVAQRDMMQGTGGGAFSPNWDLSRAMLTTILWRMEDAPTGIPPSDFLDVATGRWYSDAIAWAFDTGVVLGKGPDTFAPAVSITREQFAVMLFRFAEGAGFDITVCPDFTWDHFTDQDAVSNWATRAMRWAVYNGFITGTSATRLHPQGNASRAQTAAILMRYLQAAE